MCPIARKCGHDSKGFGSENKFKCSDKFPFSLITFLLDKICAFILSFLEVGSFLEAPSLVDSQHISEEV